MSISKESALACDCGGAMTRVLATAVFQCNDCRELEFVKSAG
jgi:hypothetical protein